LTNVLGRNVFGGGYPAQVWSRTMIRTINGLSLPVEPLPAPDDTQPQVPAKVLPNVVGQPQQVAEQMLVQLGFHVTSQPVPAPVAPGIVVYMSPSPGGPVSINTEIKLSISGGLTGTPVLPGGSPPAGLGQPVPPGGGPGLPGVFGANPREQLSSPASPGTNPADWARRPRRNRR
ncbi:PASTA domain-containing protein, partial [Frankia sp. CpI1-P]